MPLTCAFESVGCVVDLLSDFDTICSNGGGGGVGSIIGSASGGHWATSGGSSSSSNVDYEPIVVEDQFDVDDDKERLRLSSSSSLITQGQLKI